MAAALGRAFGRAITLATVPDAELDSLAGWGFDAVWLMGVWERSPAGRGIAQEHPGLQAEYRRALADFAPEDVVGSPYAIHRYEVDPHLGGRDALADLRQRLAARGLRLVLDFVPNHVAVDHPWLGTHPECFIQGTSEDTDSQPDHFFRGPVAGHDRSSPTGAIRTSPRGPTPPSLMRSARPCARSGQDAARHREPVRRHPL
ncbi:MAG: alpha-amylase family glycosyl hydrolase [Sandaracinaceae bacterium]|nr:alpha-amylase family glycosyl hydrolase [Sandaracinaceae bacterium]